MSLTDLIKHTTCHALSSQVKGSAVQRLFNPKAVAVVGATEREGSVGKTIVINLINCLKTKENQQPQKLFEIVPINPTRDTCCGLKCYKSLENCPIKVDVAVVVTPASTVSGVIESCGKAGVSVAIVISAGFKELGEEGFKLEQNVLAIAAKYNVRIVGPNCLGVMSPHIGLNATFAADHAIPGSIAFLSQSGAMCTAILDWALDLKIGFSAFVSIGSMADIEWGDFLGYFENDSNTKSIVIYMETIGNVDKFLSAAKAVTRNKPVFVIKAGQTDAAALAAASHTGSLVGSHDAFLAGMKRVGVMTLESIDELFNMLLVLGKQPQPAPRGNLSIITNAGGPGVLATDAAALHKANIYPLKPEMIKELDAILPAVWSHANPIDVLGDASADLYAKTLKIALKDSEADGVLVILSPQSVTEPTLTAKAVIKAVQECSKEIIERKTILCSWMGSKEVSEGMKLLNFHGIPTFAYPDSAAKVFGKLASYCYERMNLNNDLIKTIPLNSELLLYEPYVSKNVEDKAKELINKVYQSKRTLLTEAESKQLLDIYHIPVALTLIATNPAQVVEHANKVQYPCVLKLHSSTITHKSDVGGVQLNIKSAAEAEAAYKKIQSNLKALGKEKEFEGVTVQPMIDISKGIELILGSTNDPQFGSLILFGTGGCMVEVFKDSALGLPPLNIVEAQKLIDSTKISKALHQTEGSRFASVDINKLIILLCKFSTMIHTLSPYILECDINPLLALHNNCIALDARIILKSKAEQQSEKLINYALPLYPKHYNKMYITKSSKKTVVFNVSHASDYNRLLDFASNYIEQYSELKNMLTNKGLNNFNFTSHILPPMMFPDYFREIPIYMYDNEKKCIMGIAYMRKHALNNKAAMLQFTVSNYNSKTMAYSEEEYNSICFQFLEHLLFIAKQENINYILSQVFKENEGTLMKSLGFNVEKHKQSELFVCTYDKTAA